MAQGTLSERVERLELTVQGLERLPAEVTGLRQDVASLGERMAAVEVQISQLRTDMGVEFSAVRGKMQAGFAEVRGEMQTGFSELRDKIDENWQHTRALHEHLIEQIKTIGERGHTNAPGATPRTSGRKR